MAKIRLRPLARIDLVEIWHYIAAESDTAADAKLDRLDDAFRTLADWPLAGRARPDMADGVRSFPVGGYVVFYRPISGGIEVVRVRSHYLDTTPEDLSD